MIDLSQDIHSLSDFKRKTTEFMSRMKKDGHPVAVQMNIIAQNFFERHQNHTLWI